MPCNCGKVTPLPEVRKTIALGDRQVAAWWVNRSPWPTTWQGVSGTLYERNAGGLIAMSQDDAKFWGEHGEVGILGVDPLPVWLEGASVEAVPA
jgi:hypothetical protein